MFPKSARIVAVALIVVVGCAAASGANQRVVVDLPALSGPWTNPYAGVPQFSRLAERLEARVEEGDDAPALVLEATLKRSTDFPILMGANWSREVPLDQLTLRAENRGEADVRVGVILVLQDERRISTSFQALPSGRTQTLEYSMLDAKPPQSPGTLASVSRIEVAIRGLRAQVDYCVGFGELTFDALTPVAPVALSDVELTARAGDRIRLEWPPAEGRLPDGGFQVELTVENRQEIFLEASTRLVEADGAVILEPVELTLPRRMPGAEYEIFVDTRRVPIAGEPFRRASVGSLRVEEVAPGKPIRAKVAPWHGAPAFHFDGKLWCNENDTRTFRVMDVPNVNADQIDRRQTPEETVALLRRELGGVLAHGSAQSYFDMQGGWYDDPGLLGEVRAQAAVAREMLNRDRSSAAEVAVVVDPDAFTRQRLGTRANTWGILGQVASLGAMGAPFDLISLADVDRLGPRKMWIFLNLFAPTDDQIERVHRRLQRDGATALFAYASGLLSPNDGMRRLTGMTIRAEYGPRCADVTVPAESLGIGRDVTYGTSSPVGPASLGPGHVSPTFYIDDPQAEPLGTDAATGKPGLARKSMDGWTSVYSAAPGVAAPVLRALCRQAGVHVYVEEGAVIYANNSMLSVTVVDAGRRTIRLKKPASVTNAITGRTVAEKVSQFHIDFDQRQSKLFLLTPANDE